MDSAPGRAVKRPRKCAAETPVLPRWRRLAIARLRPTGFHGAVAQLGERLNGIQEVRGSTPLGSTILPINILKMRCFSLTYPMATNSAHILKGPPGTIAQVAGSLTAKLISDTFRLNLLRRRWSAPAVRRWWSGRFQWTVTC